MPVCVVNKLPQFKDWQKAKERLKGAKGFGVPDVSRLETEVKLVTEVKEKEDRWNVIEELLCVDHVEVIPNPDQHEEFRDLKVSQYNLYAALRLGKDSQALEKEVQLFLELWKAKEAFLQAKEAVIQYKAGFPRYILRKEKWDESKTSPTFAEETGFGYPIEPKEPKEYVVTGRKFVERESHAKRPAGGLFSCPKEEPEDPKDLVVTGSKFFERAEESQAKRSAAEKSAAKRPRPW